MLVCKKCGKMRCSSRERGLFLGMWRSKWRMCTPQTSFSTQPRLCYSAPAPTCGRGSDLFIYASSGCCSCISVSAALQILSVRGFNRSYCKDRALCLSLHFQLLLCFTCSPEPQCVTRPHCYHALICNLNPKCRIFSFPNSTASTQDSAVIRRSPSFSGLCHSRPVSRSLPLE